MRIGIVSALVILMTGNAHTQEAAQRPISEYVTVTAEQATEPARPAALAPLYVSLGTLQALDIHATYRSLGTGGAREANPVMRGAIGSRAATVALKATATAVSIYALERLWKQDGRRKTAIVTTVIINAALAGVVAHNYRVAARGAR